MPATTVYVPVYDTHTAQEPGSLFWCDAVMGLQFTHVCSFACRGRLWNLRADCSTVGLYCVKNTAKSSNFHFCYRNGSRRFAACDCWTQTSCNVGR